MIKVGPVPLELVEEIVKASGKEVQSDGTLLGIGSKIKRLDLSGAGVSSTDQPSPSEPRCVPTSFGTISENS